MKKLRVEDPVMVISGKFKGKASTIENIVGDKVFVKGINEAKRATKGKGFLKKHLPIHISNVMYYVETKKKPSKVKIDVVKYGKKTRMATKFKTKI
ncbi:MAG: 50S ribosomal protein L24 [candidate division SR1 bacterium CG_4_9_14_3_um_filter_40_9]|nr:MAG: 50S ribosomal protein L24 [candidate division SR1 bacterium CG_4_9_14_3_um_filter_40_9]